MKSKCLNCHVSIEFRPAQSRGKYCSNKCQHTFQKKQIVEKWLAGEYDGIVSKNSVAAVAESIREYLIKLANELCQKCQDHPVHPITKKIGLQVNHKDGDALNCHPNNLEVLCPTCHWKTPNYGRLNTKSTRKRRKIHYL
jgi:hypothetical protein